MRILATFRAWLARGVTRHPSEPAEPRLPSHVWPDDDGTRQAIRDLAAVCGVSAAEIERNIAPLRRAIAACGSASTDLKPIKPPPPADTGDQT